MKLTIADGILSAIMMSGACGLTAASIVMKLTMLIIVLIMLNVELSICTGRLPASRFAFSSFW